MNDLNNAAQPGLEIRFSDDQLMAIATAAWEVHSKEAYSPDGLLMACVAVQAALLSKLRATVADERISLRGAANLAFNALHECKPVKGAEKQYSDAIQALQSALHDIAYTVNRTATPQQFADHLQREDRAALASAPVAGHQPYPALPEPDVTHPGEQEDSYSRSAMAAAMRAAHDRGYSVGWDHGKEHASAPVAGEALTRFCPECGHFGDVGSGYWSCCPEGGSARMVPKSLADKCRATFQLAIKSDAAPQSSEEVRDAGIAASEDHMRPDLDRGVAGSFTAFTHWVTNRPNDQIYVHSAHEGFLAGAEWCRQQRGGDVIDDMRAAVRFAPSSAYWSERLREFFGPDAREGIDALEKQLREARAALTTQGESRG